jgi:hypothetical protein
MPKYCRSCECEFTDDKKTCPTCKETLVKKAPVSDDYFVDAYAAADEIEAERLTAYLASLGIRAREAVSGLSQFPVVSDTRFIISVQHTMLKRAHDAISQARHDRVISEDGSFL